MLSEYILPHKTRVSKAWRVTIEAFIFLFFYVTFWATPRLWGEN
ncbi:hypothetical protein M23134_04976 [Microscilla marina ATCC 23134]|uniref:Uncharacterized protein n=1 Tax=Microscilla marina ATCC 23134 TaxID=313606 RepID=A1ZXG8_MICM2|nr:hypothetical protein M23134_04976 [Microscilla marina ATCC 23134]